MAHSAFNDTKTETPDIALHAVSTSSRIRASLCDSAARDTFGRHIALASDVRLGDTSYQIAADTKVAYLDLPPRIHEDIGRLDIAVDYVVFIL